MVDTQSASLAEHVTPYSTGAPILTAAFLGKTPTLVNDAGGIILGDPPNAKTIEAQTDAAILASAVTSDTVITGDDMGHVVSTNADGRVERIHDAKGKWIDAIAARNDGTIAWSTGKTVHARDAKGNVRTATVPSTARGLAFAPKGYRLAIAHYNGASLWFPNTDSGPDPYEWKGSHLDVTFSPDGRFLVTSMQENALHGWRITDRANMRMSGYPGKVRSLAWSGDGTWLATSGADSCVIWPFKEKDGPMNKNPRECAVRKARVSRVSFHPKALLLAVGYEDGWILMCRLTDGAELLVRRPDGDRSAISAIAWSTDGNQLLFGTQGGEAGLLSLPAA